jgi:pimeloyl-ACP methyl ester carboxylesterase
MEVMPGLGHFGPLEDPGAVAESVLRAFALA